MGHKMITLAPDFKLKWLVKKLNYKQLNEIIKLNFFSRPEQTFSSPQKLTSCRQDFLAAIFCRNEVELLEGYQRATRP